MFRLIIILATITMFAACNEIEGFLGKEKKEITYSYNCLDSSVSGGQLNKTLSRAGNIVRDLAVSEDKITDSVQTAYGNIFHEQLMEQGDVKLMKDPALNRQLSNALDRLLAARENPSGIRYTIHAIEDTTVNAFTFGGRIYITKAMLEKTRSNESLLYAIIGHEIGHSEMGHIKATIQELELSNRIFGEENGSTFFAIKRLITASFNQRNELEADYYGINLTNDLGYDVCIAVSFWQEMASRENRYNQMEDFFRTHPFSNLRAECLTDHISRNFDKSCGEIEKNEMLPQLNN